MAENEPATARPPGAETPSGDGADGRLRAEASHLYRLASLNPDPQQRRALLARAHRLEQEAEGRVVHDEVTSSEPKAWKEG